MGGVVPTLSTEAPDSTAVLRFDTRARFLIGIVIIVQFIILIAYIVYSGRELPDSQLVLGAEIGFVSIVLNYFFGSSSGSVMKSASKDEKPTLP
jgi:hypothetical protein